MELNTLLMDSSTNESNKMTKNEQEQAESKTTLLDSYKYKPVHLFFKRKSSNEDQFVVEPHILTTTEEAMCSAENKEDVSTLNHRDVTAD